MSREASGSAFAYRPLKLLAETATLDGGKLLRIGRAVCVEYSRRTNREGSRAVARSASTLDFDENFAWLELLKVPEDGSNAPNVLLLNDVVIMPGRFP